MATRTASRIWCLFLVVVPSCEGLDFSMDRTPVPGLCGRLRCRTDPSDLPTHNIVTITGMTIYDITQTNSRVQLASLSIHDSQNSTEERNVQFVQSEGNISTQHADLAVFLVTEFDCRYASFLCELDFVNSTEQAVVMTRTVSPDVAENNMTLTEMFVKLSSQIRIQGYEMLKEIVATRNQLELKLKALDEKLESAGQQPKHDQLRTCASGMSGTNAREKFVLWGKVPALCDTETDGGRWVVIQRRASGDVDFYRGWEDYKKGFGTPDTDFWIGNDVIHNLTLEGYTDLRIDMRNGSDAFFSQYSDFSVADEISNYTLSVDWSSGNVTDSLIYHSGMAFSTFDKDNDNYLGHCAEEYYGAWWYDECYYANLNGRWGTHDLRGVMWVDNRVTYRYFTFTEMKVRRV